MNHPLNDPRHPWSRLTAAARQVNDERETSAPYGFATRVAALAFAQNASMASLFDRMALRALGVASLLALFSIVLNYQALSTAPATTASAPIEEVETLPSLPTDDAVAIVLDFAD
jgi:hypothetical protein